MFTRIYLIITFVFTGVCLQAQSQGIKKNSSGARFHSYNTVQVLNGSSGTALSLVSVNGLQFNRFFTGIGVGYDYYFLRTVPLFGEVKYKLTKQPKTIQLFADAGTNFLFDKNSSGGKSNPGIYWAAGFDYFIPVHDNAFSIGLGYSTKKVVKRFDNYIYNPVEGVVANVPTEQAYLLNRLAMRFSWMF